VFYQWTIEADTLEFSEAIYGGKILFGGKIFAGGEIRETLLIKMTSFLLFAEPEQKPE
jgi:hypothetical protein